MYGSSVEYPVAGPIFGKENCRGLADKSFERRKAAAQALQQLLKQQVAEGESKEVATAASDAGDDDRGKGWQRPPDPISRQQQTINAAVEKAIVALAADFLTSPLPNIRKGGLLGVAAVGLAFEDGGIEFCLPLLLRPLLKSFGDPDPRVRYYACESLFNVLKAARGGSLPFLPELFDGLCKLCGDVDREVRQGVGFVDSLLKEETATAAATAAAASAGTAEAIKGPITPAFVQLLVERLLVRNPYIKLLALSWISLLRSNTGVDMLHYLPLFLGGLLQLLGDSHRDIRQAADLCVTNFLEDLRSDPIETDPAVVAQIAEVVLRCSDSSNSSFTQLTALVWLHELLLLLLPDEGQQQQQQQQRGTCEGGTAAASLKVAVWQLEVQKHLKPLAWRMLQSILRCASEGEEEIARMATEVHAHVIARVMISTAALDLSGFVRSAVRYLRTYIPSEAAAPAAAAEGGPAAAGADVRFLCLQWMELMLVEKPHLLLLHDEQQRQQEPPQQRQIQDLKNEVMHLQPRQQQGPKEEQHKQDLLVQEQRALVSAVLYTALTAEGATVADDTAVEEGRGALGSVLDDSNRQQSATAPSDRAAATANHLLKMALSLLTRFAQRSNANLRIVTDELLLLFSADRRLLDGRGHFVLRQICTMGDPCEVYTHLAAQIERHSEAAKEEAAATQTAAATTPVATLAAASAIAGRPQQCSSAIVISDDALSRQQGVLGDTPEQKLQFLHQVVQALSIALLSAKETKGVRRQLRKGRDKTMFEALLPTWAHNSVALIALCLFAEEFQIAEELVTMLSREDALQTADLLQLEQLALLIESQAFAFLRLRLLQQPPNKHLVTAVKGIAMLLPQGPAFAMLSRRIQLVGPSGCCCNNSNARRNMSGKEEPPPHHVIRALALARAAREQFGELPSLNSITDELPVTVAEAGEQAVLKQTSASRSLTQQSTEPSKET